MNKLTLNRETLRVLNQRSLGTVVGGEVTQPTICQSGTAQYCESAVDCQEATCACPSEFCTHPTITAGRPTCKMGEGVG